MLKTLIGATLGTMVAFSGFIPAQAESMLVSDRDRNLAINAWGGAKQSTVLRLNAACQPGNRDCRWGFGAVNLLNLSHFNIVSDRDPSLAINAWGGAKDGTVLRLNNACKPDNPNPDCTWHVRNHMIVSDRDPSLAINAYGGAEDGTVLRLHNTCKPDNPDCTWSWVSPVGE